MGPDDPAGRMRDSAGVRLRIVVGVAGLLLALAAVIGARRSPTVSFAGGSWTGAVLLVAAGLGLVGAGAAVAARRGGAAGWMLVGAGGAWFVATWANPQIGVAATFTVGIVAGPLVAPLTAGGVLARPSGRPVDRVAAVVLCSGVLTAFVVIGAALWNDPHAGGCTACTPNLLAVSDDPSRFVGVGRVGLHLVSAWATAVIAVLCWRLARARHDRHRRAALPTAALLVYLACVAWAAHLAARRGFVGTDASAHRGATAQAVGLVAVAAAVGWTEWQIRRRRARVAAVVVDLDRSTHGGVRAVLAAALDDKELVVAYPLDAGRFVDVDGHDVDVARRPGVAVTPIARDGGTIAVVIHGVGVTARLADLDGLVAVTRLALENERLRAVLRAREDELRVSRARVIAASDSARQRMERDLHDGAQQRLVALIAGARLLQARLAAIGDSTIQTSCTSVVDDLQTAIGALRSIAHGLYPSVLDDEGLAVALESLADDHPETLMLDGGLGSSGLGTEVGRAVYWAAAMACADGATRIAASHDESWVHLDLELPNVPVRYVDLQDRVGVLDGRTSLQPAAGGAVRVRVELPCGS